jgi:hypothetical protein
LLKTEDPTLNQAKRPEPVLVALLSDSTVRCPILVCSSSGRARFVRSPDAGECAPRSARQNENLDESELPKIIQSDAVAPNLNLFPVFKDF